MRRYSWLFFFVFLQNSNNWIKTWQRFDNKVIKQIVCVKFYWQTRSIIERPCLNKINILPWIVRSYILRGGGGGGWRGFQIWPTERCFLSISKRDERKVVCCVGASSPRSGTPVIIELTVTDGLSEGFQSTICRANNPLPGNDNWIGNYLNYLNCIQHRILN